MIYLILYKEHDVQILGKLSNITYYTYSFNKLLLFIPRNRDIYLYLCLNYVLNYQNNKYFKKTLILQNVFLL